jgi:hypothetical protein
MSPGVIAILAFIGMAMIIGSRRVRDPAHHSDRTCQKSKALGSGGIDSGGFS